MPLYHDIKWDQWPPGGNIPYKRKAVHQPLQLLFPIHRNRLQSGTSKAIASLSPVSWESSREPINCAFTMAFCTQLQGVLKMISTAQQYSARRPNGRRPTDLAYGMVGIAGSGEYSASILSAPPMSFLGTKRNHELNPDENLSYPQPPTSTATATTLEPTDNEHALALLGAIHFQGSISFQPDGRRLPLH